MKISGIIEEANDVADKYNLQLAERGRTDNIISYIFVDVKKSIQEFTRESMMFLEERGIL